jgi:HlyD family secretion protein
VKGNEAIAWTVEEGRLQQRTISLGQRSLDGRIEILGGLPEGAEVVDGPTTGLKIGRKATIDLAEDKGP